MEEIKEDLFDKEQQDSGTRKQARSLGLTYLGFGRYGLAKDGKIHVTHIAKNNKLKAVISDIEGGRDQWDSSKPAKPKKPKIQKVPSHFSNWEKKYGNRYKKDVEKRFKNKEYDLGYGVKNTDYELEDKADKYDRMSEKLEIANARKYRSMGIHKNRQLLDVVSAMQETTDDINSLLYKGAPLDRYKHRRAAWKLRVMDDAFESDDFVADQDYTVYTGTAANIEKGNDYLFRGFLSTSMNPNVAGAFTKSKKDAQATLIQIDVKKGNKIIDMNAIFTANEEGDDFGYGSESEHLLPRATKLRIKDDPIHMDNGTIVWRAEIVDEKRTDE